MSVLGWNMTQVSYLKHCAESTSNAESIVNFSPSLKNMGKHGNCTAITKALMSNLQLGKKNRKDGWRERRREGGTEEGRSGGREGRREGGKNNEGRRKWGGEMKKRMEITVFIKKIGFHTVQNVSTI